MELELRGRTGFVTGASAGIGRAIARVLAGEGVRWLVAFLASPRASYLTGAVIPVDGGLRRYQF